MDQAWGLEREQWEAANSGRAGDFYAQHMTADGFVVVPGRTIDRHELIRGWREHEPLRTYHLSEPRMILVDGESVLISYHVTADAAWLPDYRAQVTALYTWNGGTWALAFRQHTPDTEGPSPL